MKITFLGTRGNIDIRSKEHRRHTSTLFEVPDATIMIDAGIDWQKKINTVKADALFITHAHSDHAGGLKKGSPVPVYATQETWQIIDHYPISKRNVVTTGKSIRIGSLSIKAFEVVHSLNAPAVGYRISHEGNNIFYVPDIVKIKKEKQALSSLCFYCGDGAIIKRSLLVKKRNSMLIGHTSIKTQLGWCKKNRVPLMVVTHCGTEIVSQPHPDAQKKVDALAQKVGVKALIATDNMELVI